MTIASLRKSILTAALALAACNPYDPQLPDMPFRCEAPGYACPDGYEADRQGDSCLCVLPGESADHPDAAPIASCARDRALEPNETTAEPAQAGISTAAPQNSIAASICDVNDRDVYSFTAGSGDTKAVAKLTSTLELATFGLRLTDGKGTSLATAVVVGSELGIDFPLPSPGVYYIEVTAATTGEAAYDLSLQLE